MSIEHTEENEKIVQVIENEQKSLFQLLSDRMAKVPLHWKNIKYSLSKRILSKSFCIN